MTVGQRANCTARGHSECFPECPLKIPKLKATFKSKHSQEKLPVSFRSLSKWFTFCTFRAFVLGKCWKILDLVVSYKWLPVHCINCWLLDVESETEYSQQRWTNDSLVRCQQVPGDTCIISSRQDSIGLTDCGPTIH